MRIHLWKRTAIGVDIGTHAVKAVQAWVAGGEAARVMQVRTAAMPRKNGEALTAEEAREFGQLLGRRGLLGKTVVVGVRAKELKLEPLELPPDDGHLPAAQLAAVELGRIHRLKGESCEHAVWAMPAPSRGGAATHVMGVALPHERGLALAMPLLEAGLDVAAMVPEMVSLAALAGRCGSLPAERLHLVVDVGWSGTRLLVVRNGMVLFQRTVEEASLLELQGRLGKQLELPAESAAHLVSEVGVSEESEALPGGARESVMRAFLTTVQLIVSEMRLTQNYIAHKYQQFAAGSVVLLGGGAAVPGLRDLLARETGEPVVSLAETDLVALQQLGKGAETWMNALGLAVYGLEAER